jgi:osmoprotectant transport system substrate-binding protein
MPVIRLRNFAVFLLLLLLAGACATGDDGSLSDSDAGGDASEAADASEPAGESGPITVGSTDFSEQLIVAEMYRGALEAAGIEASDKYNLGSREIVEPALENGEIDLYPEYVGTALEFLNGGAGEATSDTDETLAKLQEAFAEKDIEVLEPAEAQDKNAIVVTRATADELGLTTVSDLAEHAPDLVFGGPPECPERPLCLMALEDTYELDFAEFRSLDAGGPLTVAALEDGEIDVALMFTTQGIIAEKDFVSLEDDKGLQPAENIVPVIRSEKLTPEVEEILNAVSAKLTTEELTELNRRVDVDKEDPEAVAQEWLADNGFTE